MSRPILPQPSPSGEASRGYKGASGAPVRARFIELESLLQKTAAAIRGGELPERTASRLRRVLEEDRLTEAEPDG